MTGPPVTQHDQEMSRRWFGTNRGTHWTVGGSVMAIILGGYFIYSNRDSTRAVGDAAAAIEQAPIPPSPALQN